MSKERNNSKEAKKPAKLTLKEKRAVKQAKKAPQSNVVSKGK